MRRVTRPGQAGGPRQAEGGSASCAAVVKRVRALGEAESEAGVPYEETRLARQSVKARARLSGLLLLAVAALLIEAVLQLSVGWALAAIVVGATAWGVRKDRLGAVVAAALVAMLCALLPLRFFFEGERDVAALLTMGLSMVFGIACLPDVVLLLRDAELQYAYGRWARRDEP